MMKLLAATVLGLLAVGCAHAPSKPPGQAKPNTAAPQQVALTAAPRTQEVLSADGKLAEVDRKLAAIEADPDIVDDLDSLIEDTPDTESIPAAGEAEAAPVEGGIPLVYNARVQKLISFFQGRGRERFELWLSRSGMYIPMMQRILVEEGLPPDLVYLALIESGFSPYAYSSAAAVGYWQFISATGRRYGLRIDEWVDERRNPDKATRAAARYLRDLYGMFGDWHLAAAGYNAGEGKIARAMRMYDSSDYWDIVEKRYLKPETKDYVPKLIAAITIAKNPQQYGFNPQYFDPLTHSTVMVQGGEDLNRLAYAAGVSFTALKRLNPELKRWLVPPADRLYPLNVPVGAEVAFGERLATAPADLTVPFTEVKLGKHDTLEKVAKLHRVSVADLRTANPKLHVRPGATVRIPIGEDGTRYAEYPAKPRFKTRAVHKVRNGETLQKIAKRYRVNAYTLAEYNGLSTTSRLSSGQRLNIPGKVKKSAHRGKRGKAKRGSRVAKR